MFFTFQANLLLRIFFLHEKMEVVARLIPQWKLSFLSLEKRWWPRVAFENGVPHFTGYNKRDSGIHKGIDRVCVRMRDRIPAGALAFIALWLRCLNYYKRCTHGRLPSHEMTDWRACLNASKTCVSRHRWYLLTEYIHYFLAHFRNLGRFDIPLVYKMKSVVTIVAFTLLVSYSGIDVSAQTPDPSSMPSMIPSDMPSTTPSISLAPSSQPTSCASFSEACVFSSDCCSNRCVLNKCQKPIVVNKTKLGADRGGAGGGGDKDGGGRRIVRGRRRARGL